MTDLPALRKLCADQTDEHGPVTRDMLDRGFYRAGVFARNVPVFLDEIEQCWAFIATARQAVADFGELPGTFYEANDVLDADDIKNIRGHETLFVTMRAQLRKLGES